MIRKYALLLITVMVLVVISNSCLKSTDCITDLFEKEGLFMDISVKGTDYYVDYGDNNILTGLMYQLDTTREDTLIFYYDCHFVFGTDSGYITLTMAKYSDFYDAINYGYGNLNYMKFEEILKKGDYKYLERSDTLADPSVAISYYLNDSTNYRIDRSEDEPEDFHFTIDTVRLKSGTDCYNRNVEWFTFSGTFGCRMVDSIHHDTILINDAEFKAAIAQYHFGTL